MPDFASMPDSTTAKLVQRGDVWANLGQFRAALCLYDWAISLNPFDQNAIKARDKALRALSA